MNLFVSPLPTYLSRSPVPMPNFRIEISIQIVRFVICLNECFN